MAAQVLALCTRFSRARVSPASQKHLQGLLSHHPARQSSEHPERPRSLRKAGGRRSLSPTKSPSKRRVVTRFGARARARRPRAFGAPLRPPRPLHAHPLPSASPPPRGNHARAAPPPFVQKTHHSVAVEVVVGRLLAGGVAHGADGLLEHVHTSFSTALPSPCFSTAADIAARPPSAMNGAPTLRLSRGASARAVGLKGGGAGMPQE